MTTNTETTTNPDLAAPSELARGRATEHADPAPRPRDADSPARAADILLAALRSQIGELRAQDPQVRHEVPGAVTLMRVATRRLRSTLGGFSRILDPEYTRAVAEELSGSVPSWPRSTTPR